MDNRGVTSASPDRAPVSGESGFVWYYDQVGYGWTARLELARATRSLKNLNVRVMIFRRMTGHLCNYLFASTLLIYAAFATGAVDDSEDGQSLSVQGEAELSAVPDPGNWQSMFRRDMPRSFARFPEDVFEYIRQGNGFYTQLASTTIWQAASSSKTGRDSLLNTNFSFAGGWQPLRNAAISWWFLGGRLVGEPRDANLSTDIGSILDVAFGPEDTVFYIQAGGAW